MSKSKKYGVRHITQKNDLHQVQPFGEITTFQTYLAIKTTCSVYDQKNRLRQP